MFVGDKEMRRPIKFRVWDKENNRWFVPTYQVYNDKLEHLLLNLNGGLLIRTLESISSESTFPERFEISQFTGLHDRNGKEIYEGDRIKQIVYATDFNKRHFGIKSPTEKIATIVWDGDNACFITEFNSKDQWHPNYEVFRILDADVEVIGNIFESGGTG